MLIPIITTLTKFVISAIKLAHKNNKHKDAKLYVLITLTIFATVILSLIIKT